MTVRNLEKILQPSCIVVVGEGDNAGAAHTVLTNLVDSGFKGPVLSVGVPTAPTPGVVSRERLVDVDGPPDLAVVCTSAEAVPSVVRQCGEAGIGAVVVTGPGFREIGPEGRALEQRIEEERSRYGNMRILGPKSLGVVVPHWNLNASLAGAAPKEGRVAFISQSGTLCTSALDWAITEDIGFSHFVSIGNMLDISVGDLIDYFAADPHTDSIVLFLESIRGARQFMSAARAITKVKPIVVYTAGRFAESAAAAVSHPGAPAGVDAVYEAAFERAGIVRVSEIDDMFDCAQLLARQPRPTGPRLAIITNAGGPGVVATDCLIGCKGSLARLSDGSIAELSDLLPRYWSHSNPVDILGDASAERFCSAIDVVLADQGVDAVLVILTPQAATEPTKTAQALVQLSQRSHKLLLAAWMGGRAVHDGICVLKSAGIPAYTTPKNAVHAFMHWVSYARSQETLNETPRNVLPDFSLDRDKQREILDSIVSDSREVLSEATSKKLLDSYGISIAKPWHVESAIEAVAVARRIGFPVVLKIVSPEITHKNEVGGVVLNVSTENDVLQAFNRIVDSVKVMRPNARIEGVSVQPMISAPDGFEIILGSRKDPVFGAVVIVGAGGVAAEVIDDRALGLPPLNERMVRRMLESLRSWPILAGYRNRVPVDIEGLIRTVIRFSHLVADCPQIAECDVNPLLVTPRDVIALDARVRIDRGATNELQRPYSHLAIRPYPAELVRPAVLKGGARVTLRPIKPEDEPLWHEMMSACSTESIRYRFRYLFNVMLHEIAARYCFIDYDRELVIVAEIEQEGNSSLIGVGQLMCDADHADAEYAVLVADAWQGRGLGRILTDYCLEIAESWDLMEVFGETDRTNRRMIATFKRAGFELVYGADTDVVSARKALKQQHASVACGESTTS